MDYDEFHEAAKKILFYPQIKITFSPGRTGRPHYPYKPTVAIGAMIAVPKPRHRIASDVPDEALAPIRETVDLLGRIKFGRDNYVIEYTKAGFQVKMKYIELTPHLVRPTATSQIRFSILTGELWLEYKLLDPDEITRDLDLHIRYYLDDVPEYQNIIREKLEKYFNIIGPK